MEKSIATREYKILTGLLRVARKSKNITQAELAALLGEVQSFVSDCERAQRRLDVIEVWRWCEALGVSFAQLASEFEGKVRKPRPKRTR